jgi:hypothetical protein
MRAAMAPDEFVAPGDLEVQKPLNWGEEERKPALEAARAGSSKKPRFTKD